MTDKDEIPGPNPDIFTYRAKDQGRGRYRLAACTRDSRIPVRILRSHSLQGFWSPRAGIRYDGLYVSHDPHWRAWCEEMMMAD